jgi:molecular chaperone Hsp33
MSKDFLQKFMFEHIPVKGCLVRLEQSWQEVRQRAKPDPEATAMLGQAVSAAALLASSIKYPGTVSLQIQSSGRLRFLLGQCSNGQLVRGISRKNPELEAKSELLVNPVLAINLEPDQEGTPYQGIVPIENGNLTSALELYFAQSEQLETRFWMVANEVSCAAFMLQRMPGEHLDEDDFGRIIHLASTVTDRELLNTDPAQLLHLLFSEDNVRLYNAEALKFGCRCSQDRVSGVLQSLGRQEIESLLQERGKVEVLCEYCGKEYLFDPIDIAGIFSESGFRLNGSPGVH